MGLVEHLMQSRTPLELAKELAHTVKENADLKRQIVALQVEVFWLRTKENDTDGTNLPIPPQPANAAV
jgi:hypothetical protein